MVNRRYEQGGVVSFVIVATVLALLLAGGLWLAKRQTAVTPVPATVSQNTPAPSPFTSSPSNSTPQPSTNTPSDGQTSSTNTTNGQSSQNTSPTPSASTHSVASTGPSGTEVPSTGPKEVLATVVSVAVMSGGIYLFVQSHKRVRLSALK